MDKIGQYGHNWTLWTTLDIIDKIGQFGQNWTKLDNLDKIGQYV